MKVKLISAKGFSRGSVYIRRTLTGRIVGISLPVGVMGRELMRIDDIESVATLSNDAKDLLFIRVGIFFHFFRSKTTKAEVRFFDGRRVLIEAPTRIVDRIAIYAFENEEYEEEED